MADRTIEELKAARERKRVEYAALPNKGVFGDNNRAAEALLLSTFDKLIAGEDAIQLQDALYDTVDLDSSMDYITNESIGLCDWARGWEDDGFEAKE